MSHCNKSLMAIMNQLYLLEYQLRDLITKSQIIRKPALYISPFQELQESYFYDSKKYQPKICLTSIWLMKQLQSRKSYFKIYQYNDYYVLNL